MERFIISDRGNQRQTLRRERVVISKLRNLFKDVEGATMVEYALMLSLIAIVCYGAVVLIGTSTSTSFQNAAAKFPD